MTKAKKVKKKNKTTFDLFLEHLHALNNSKFFAGIIMLTMNIGSKYISLELSKSQEDYVKYTIGRQILVFAILWMGTRDIVVALVLTCVFILFAIWINSIQINAMPKSGSLIFGTSYTINNYNSIHCSSKIRN